MIRRNIFIITLVICVASPSASRLDAADSWPQFRGVNSSGLARSARKLPANIGPETNVIWKVAVPPGHSSPVVSGERVYLTAVRGRKLLTICQDRGSGKMLWETEAPYKVLETIHRIGSYAQCTPTTDGERVVSFFGSCGLFCYNTSGRLLWQKRMGPFNNDFGAGEGKRRIMKDE